MNVEGLYKIIIAPYLSEKAVSATEKRNEYVFKVLKSATKSQIKKAVELLFATKVTSVSIVNVKRKLKRFGKIEGSRKAWKKAYVTLLTDHKIDFAAP